MKKIMIAACAVALAVTAQAAAFAWQTSGTGKLYNGNSSDLYTGTAYLFDSAAVSQQAVLEAWASGKSLGGSLDSKDIKAGAIAKGTTTFDWGNAGDMLYAFVVVDDGDKIFISNTASKMGDVAATQTFQFSLKSGSQVDPIEFEAGSAKFSAQGWYKSTGGGVPEPTSGFLLVLGMAGLALRRRRA